MRVTKGKFLNDGEEFVITDDHALHVNAHRNLRSGWVGTTEFYEVEEIIEEGEITKRVNWADVVDDDRPADWESVELPAQVESGSRAAMHGELRLSLQADARAFPAAL